MKLARVLSMAALLSACGSEPGIAAGPACPKVASASAPVAPAASPAWRVQLATDAREGSLKVRIEMPHGDFGVWALTRPQGKVRAVAAHDASGVVEVERSGEASFTLRPARAVVPPLVLEYEVLPPEAQGGAFPMEVTPDRAAFSGASVLVTPTGHASERVDLRLTLLPSDDFHQRAASSLAPEAEVSTSVSFDELAAAAFVFGAVGVAKFSAPEGRDHAAWVGYFSFDPRWASAEAAGVRTMADRWLGITRPAGDPSVGLVFVATRGHTRELGITPALRGALVQADVSAPWSARARIDVTRLFVQRTIGPAISLRADGCSGRAATLWFDEGLAHAVALDVLREAGILSNEEIISEVNAWLGEEALSPYAKRPLAEVCALATSEKREGVDARRLLAVRGALVGLALSDLSADVLRPSVRDLLSLAQSSARPDHPMSALFEAAEKRGAKRAGDLQKALTSGAEIPLTPKGLGPCAALGERTVHPFALGFTTIEKEGHAFVQDVVARSNAAKAGVRPGDAIVSFDYAPGWTSVPVRLQLERGGAVTKLQFLPQGPGKPGRGFTAVRSPACAD